MYMMDSGRAHEALFITKDSVNERPDIGLSSFLMTPDAKGSTDFARNYFDEFNQQVDNQWHLTVFTNYLENSASISEQTEAHDKKLNEIRSLFNNAGIKLPEMCFVFFNSHQFGRHFEKVKTQKELESETVKILVFKLDPKSINNKPLYRAGIEKVLSHIDNAIKKYKETHDGEYIFYRHALDSDNEDKFLEILEKEFKKTFVDKGERALKTISAFVVAQIMGSICGVPLEKLVKPNVEGLVETVTSYVT